MEEDGGAEEAGGVAYEGRTGGQAEPFCAKNLDSHPSMIPTALSTPVLGLLKKSSLRYGCRSFLTRKYSLIEISILVYEQKS